MTKPAIIRHIENFLLLKLSLLLFHYGDEISDFVNNCFGLIIIQCIFNTSYIVQNTTTLI